MKIATWNVNSIRARLPRLLDWLAKHRPDVLCLQELKVEAKAFPAAPLAALGYEAVVCGQRSYNGVALLSRAPMTGVTAGMDDGDPDPQARLISGVLVGVRVLSVYMPNGQSVPSDKFEYKLRWMERFRAHVARAYRPDERLVVCGDFNVAPEPADVYDPAGWVNEPIFHADARASLARIAGFGWVDVVRQHHPEPALYSYWDYRMQAFAKDHGLRIDHLWATPPQATRCTMASVDREARKGAAPSDHAPLIAEFAD